MKYRIVFLTILSLLFLTGLFFLGDFFSGWNKALLKELLKLNEYVFSAANFIGITIFSSSLVIAARQLKQQRYLGQTINFVFIGVCFCYLLFLILGYLLLKMNLWPTEKLPTIEQIQNSFSNSPISQTMELFTAGGNHFLDQIKTLPLLSSLPLFPLFLFAVFLGLSMCRDREVAEPLYNVLDSISRLMFQWIQTALKWISYFLLLNSIYWIWQLKTAPLRQYYTSFFLNLGLLSLLITLAVIPAFLFLFQKERSPYRWLWNNIISVVAAFFTANSIFAASTMIVEQRQRYFQKRNTSGFLVPLYLLLLRPGSALVLCYSFAAYYTATTRWEMGFGSELLWLILIPIGLSMLMGLFSLPVYQLILPLYFLLYNPNSAYNYLLIAPSLFIGQSIAAMLDVVSWNLMNHLYQKRYGEKIE